MANIKIVADSSANLLSLEHTPFGAAALKVITNDREFTDNSALDVGIHACRGLCSYYAEKGGMLVGFEKL